MSDLVYTFTFPRRALGLDVVITDNAGQTVAIADDPTLTLTADNGNAYIELSLPHENSPYSAAVSSSRVGAFSTEGQVALAESIADAPGAAETAYFIAEGPVYLADGNGAAGNLNFTADDRQGDLPDWVSLASGDVVLGEDAGTCAFALKFQTDFDFTGETPPTGAGNISDYTGVFLDSVAVLSATSFVSDADGEVLQSTDVNTRGGLLVGETVTVSYAPFADGNVGEATPRVALTITRLAPAPTLPA